MNNEKRNKKKEDSVIVVLLRTFAEMLYILKYGIIESLDKVAVIIQIAIPVMIARSNMNMVQMTFMSLIMVILLWYIKEVWKKLNNVSDNGMPIPRHRFTREDANGFIYISDSDREESTIYLYELEEYYKKRGLM